MAFNQRMNDADAGDVVQLSYRRWNNVVFLLGICYRDTCAKLQSFDWFGLYEKKNPELTHKIEPSKNICNLPKLGNCTVLIKEMHLLSWTNRYLYFKITINVDEQPLQARHQEFFRAGKVFQNKGTSINFLSATQEGKAP